MPHSARRCVCVLSIAAVVLFVPASRAFPLFSVYSDLVNLNGGTPVPLGATRYWEWNSKAEAMAHYPTSGNVYTSIADLNSAIASAASGTTLRLGNGSYADATVAIPSDRSGLIIAAETPGGVTFTGVSYFDVDGKECDILGFKGTATFDIDGDDTRIALCTIDGATTPRSWVTFDAVRCRLAFCTLQNKGEGQMFNIVNQTSIPTYCRVDHNYFLNHQGADEPISGASEIAQVGQDQSTIDYFALIDNNYIYRHLNDGAGSKTVANESETISFKSAGNMFIRNVMVECSSGLTTRAGRRCAYYANFIFGGVEFSGGPRLHGPDNLILCNYIADTNPTDKAGGSALDFGSGGTGTYVAADNNEASFNTIVNVKRPIALGRSADRPNIPDGVRFYNNAVERNGDGNTIWVNNASNSVYGGNVMEPAVGVTDAGINAAIPGLVLTNGYYVPTPGGNCEGKGSTAHSSVATVDILGNAIPINGPNVGCFQAGWDLSIDPVLAIIEAAGAGPVVSDSFDYPNGALPAHYWSEGNAAQIQNGRLYVNANGGSYNASTIWLNQAFSGDLRIEYDAHVLSSANDVNNINNFVLYSDPSGIPLYDTRSDRLDGSYNKYHNLNGYITTYVKESGSGRFRLRDVPGFNNMLAEAFTYNADAGVTRHVVIEKIGDQITYKVDGNTILDVTDDQFNPVHQQGLFGFRTFGTELWWDNLMVTQLAGGGGSGCLNAQSDYVWMNESIANQTGSFTVEFDSTPSVSPMDGVVGLSDGTAADYPNLAAIVRFNSSGNIDVRNDGTYGAAVTFPYSANTSYHFRMVVDVATHTYTVYVTPLGGSEQTLATNYAFRTEQASVTQLNNVGSRVGTNPGTGSVQTCNIIVTTGSPPDITTTTLPSGRTTIGYGDQQLTATGGTTPYTWSLSSGTLPAGLGLSTGGVISGTPTTAGTLNFTARVTDAGSQTDDQPLAITINTNSIPDITTTSLPGGTEGVAYNQSVASSGGDVVLLWSVLSGSLPPGLTLSNVNNQNATVSGTPTTAGTSSFTLKLEDVDADSDTQALSIEIGVPPPGSFTLSSPADTTTGVATTPTLDWTDANGAASYMLLVDDNSDFSSPVINETGIATSQYAVGTSLANNTTYYWQVTAVNAGGSTPASNNNFSFSTESGGGTPAKFSIPGGSVIASADDGNVPANTVDGNLATRWSAQGDPQWIRYDLGSISTISYVKIAWHQGDARSASFDIEVSDNATSWTNVFSGTSSGTTTALETYDFTDTTARYVRVVGHGNSVNNWNSITETEIWGIATPAIAFRAASNATSGSSAASSIVVNKPTGVVNGDFMLAGITANTISVVITAPADWVLVRRIPDGSMQLAIYRKQAGASEPGSYTWTLSANEKVVGGIVAFTGVNSATPIQAENGAGESTASTTHTTPTIATSGSATWLVSFFGDRTSSGSTWTSSGADERVDVSNTGAPSVSLAIYTEGPVTAGNKSRSATASVSSDKAAMAIIAIQP